jgi:hypothetical protein
MRRLLLAVIIMSLATLVPAAWGVPLYQTDYTFNVDYCSTGCLFGGTGGTITLSDTSTAGQVKVDVALIPSLDAFHDNSFQSFAFNLNGISTISLVGSIIGTGSWSLTNTTAGSFHQDGSGNYEFGVNCSNCGPSNGDVTATSLSFIISGTGLTTDSFHELSSGGSPSAYFSAAVFNLTNTSCTGVIGADGATTPRLGGSNTGTGTCGSSSPVPEPTSIVLFGTALAFAAKFLHRRLAL